MSSTTYNFHVSGMHCKACELMTESELQEVPNVTHVKSSLKNNSVEVVGDFNNQSPQEVAEILSAVLVKHGYSLSVEQGVVVKDWSDFKYAIPIALAFVLAFIFLQKVGLVNLIDISSVSYPTAFIVGIIASLSTCMAVVGGLLLSMSATFAKEGYKYKSQFLFHGGRIVAFFLFGGVIGALGSAFVLNTATTFILSFSIGVVMLILGINLLAVFHWAKRFQPTMPKFLSKYTLGVTKLNHALTPLLIGAVTFFLPCGFTQSMQIYTLSTGSFLKGALTMFAFALGTLPVLAIISFSSFSIQNSPRAGIFFKTAGLIVIMFALFNLINSLVVIGLLPPVFSF